MGALARVFEAAGLVTVGLSLVREQAVNIKGPRFLHVEFPLGRPLGKPGDAEFQTDVIRSAFALLDRTDVPVLEDFGGEEIEDETGEMASCVIPPRDDSSLHPAVAEALALRPAYNRQLASAGGRTALGRVADADNITDAVETMVALGEGTSLDDLDIDGPTVRAMTHDLRAYYEEAGLALVDHVPAARRLETWYFQGTETGKLVTAASKNLQDAGAEYEVWFYMRPATQA